MKAHKNANDVEYTSEIQRIVFQGGPEAADYPILNRFLDKMGNSLYTDKDHEDMERIYGEKFMQSRTSVLGHIKNRPYGYAGDFKIIDRIYTAEASLDFEKWDNYALTQAGAQAVINRKSFFKKILTEKLTSGPINLLNVASGPARDLNELYNQFTGNETLTTDCVEIDSTAIEYASHLCKDHLSNITFIKGNIFRFTATKKYNVIWSAGLFDYLSDKEFVMILRNLLGSLAENGEIIIGNFSDNNPSRNFMELLGDWFLNHRSIEELIDLAMRAGASRDRITVDKEPLGINLFLRITA